MHQRQQGHSPIFRLPFRQRPRAGDYIFLWVTNRGAARMTLNSIISARRAGIDAPERLVVASLDDEAGEIVTSQDERVTLLPMSDLESWRHLGLPAENDYRPFGTREFAIAALARYVAIEHLLAARKRPVIYADGDIVYLRDPSDYVSRLQKRSRLVLMQNDRPGCYCGDEWQSQYGPGDRTDRSTICTGFMVWPLGRPSLALAQSIIGSILCEGNWPIDQDVVNRLPRRWQDRIMLLRQDHFPNGPLVLPETYTIVSDKSRPDFDWRSAYMVHANFTLGVDTKIAALKAIGLWYLAD